MSGNSELLNIIKSNVANTMYNQGVLGSDEILGSGLVGGVARRKSAIDKQKTIVARLKMAKDVYKGMPSSPQKRSANEKYRKALAKLRSLKSRRRARRGGELVGGAARKKRRVGAKKKVARRRVGAKRKVAGRRKANANTKILKELKKIAAKLK